jgi:CheY-like chemotaxis protein
MRVLVVDEDADMLEVLGRHLRLWGHLPVVAADGPTALAAAAASPPDLVLLDLALPGMPGWEVACRLREALRLRDVPIVVLSGLPIDRARELCSSACVDHFLAKPLEAEAMRALLGQYNGQRGVGVATGDGWTDPRAQRPEPGCPVVFETSGVVARIHTGTYGPHGPKGELAFVNERGVGYAATVVGWRPLQATAVPASR